MSSGQLIQEMYTYPCKMVVLVLGPPVSHTTSVPSTLEVVTESTTQLKTTPQSGVHQSSCMVAGLHDGEPSRLSSDVESRV